MSDDEMRIAIAEACGKKFCEHQYDSEKMFCTRCGWNPHFMKTPIEAGTMNPIPDYPNDLNAMHEAEKVLTAPLRYTYVEYLKDICTPKYIWCATARQRAEAFLRTIGKWTTPRECEKDSTSETHRHANS